ncbi:ferredoxin [Actinocatenispora rupis]|uniref:Ferredoxin n=1 Tax=Actinocatenispora rupis TaxID=519421 RepID=A0A8J3JGE5_9ACTN|nr:ferredoxin [Actinocatenispora rupis]GID16239.1 ferredoxin [Actinocatenispora rupis]
MRISADTDVCIGAGQCVLTEPAVFDQDDAEGTVVLHTTEPAAEYEDAVRDAVQLCPAQALSIVEE